MDENVKNTKYTLTLGDLQTVLDYLSKRPLGEVLEVFKAIQRAQPVVVPTPEVVEEVKTEEAPQA